MAQGREAAGKSFRVEQYWDFGDELCVRLPASPLTFEPLFCFFFLIVVLLLRLDK